MKQTNQQMKLKIFYLKYVNIRESKKLPIAQKSFESTEFDTLFNYFSTLLMPIHRTRQNVTVKF